jgi:hypothetical protein
VNLAFPAILIILLTLPGILLRLGYKKGPNGAWKNPFTIQSLGDEIAWSIALAALLHVAGIWIWSSFIGPADVKSTLTLLMGAKDDIATKAIDNVSQGGGYAATYFLILYLAAYSLGILAHMLVRGLGLDHRCSLFRFDNPWFYLLSGESLETIIKERPRSWWERLKNLWPLTSPRKADIVKISAAVKQGSDVYLYAGRLGDFEFDRTGQLDRLVLSEASRRLLKNDRSTEKHYDPTAQADDRFYLIETLHFVIRYCDICTLNIEYIILRDKGHSEDTIAPALRGYRPRKSWPCRKWLGKIKETVLGLRERLRFRLFAGRH